MKNYDASIVGTPYIRVSNVSINYQSPLSAVVRYEEVESVVSVDGQVLSYKNLGVKTFSISESDFDSAVGLVDPTTGSSIEGQSTTPRQVMLGILAIIRNNQLSV